ncbi:MAG: DUF1549 domain-containing protein, partial [Actinomycetota bacterium]
SAGARRWLAVVVLAGAASTPLLAAAPTPARPSASDSAFFESRVRPLLAKHCFACHSQKIAQAGLRLDTQQGMLKGGDSGPAVVAGKPDQSALIRAVKYSDAKLQMPPSGKLTEAEIAVLADWVGRGAHWPSETAKPTGGAKGPLGLAAGRKFWAFQPFAAVKPPVVKQKQWVARPIDAFILAKLEARGLNPSPAADRRTLLRRLSFDLVGLPPTPDELQAFIEDRSPDAYEKQVERLLASPHYGERWARHWLDLVRYCDVPESWAVSEAQPWLYRDWVVEALNRDLPYDQFVRLQLAADEMPEAKPTDIAALGFIGLSPSYWKELKLAPDVIKTVVAEEWEERIHTVSSTLLGLTVACARCHDHKFDPISQDDYYALAGVFASTRLTPRPLLPEPEADAVMKARAKVKALEAEAKRLQDMAAKTPAQAEMLRGKAAENMQAAAQLKQQTPHFNAPVAYAVDSAYLDVLPDGPNHTKLSYRDGVGLDVPMQLRGNPAKEGRVVPRRFLTVLSPKEPARFTHGSGRRDLGDAIFRDSAPLAARVMVNRVWKHHFGSGLVETPSNFGVQGDAPTHPELLEALATRFVRNGWSLKWLHREILMSAAYRQVSEPSAKLVAADPDNRLLGRMSRTRLEVEAWRDAILSASGTLDARLGGAAQELSSKDNVRRTIYGTVTRRDLDHLLRLYDFPDPTTHSPARFHTTTPLQQLFVLNSEFITQQAAALTARLKKVAPGDVAAQVRRAYVLLYGREPRAEEVRTAQEFLAAGDDETWRQYAQVLLARNELIFVN